MSSAETTTDHEVIRKWIEARGGHPAVVRATEDDDRPGGIIRVDFKEPDEGLEEMDWDGFFEVFEESKLAFLHQDKTKDGSVSRFNRFVKREED